MNRFKIVSSFLAVATLAAVLPYVRGSAYPGSNSLGTAPALALTPSSAFAPAPPQQPSCHVLWLADMESNLNPGAGLPQWYLPHCCNAGDVVAPVYVNCEAVPGPTTNHGGGIFNSGIASAGPSSDFAHRGTYSAILKINTIQESGTRLFRWLEPRINNSDSDLYYSAWYYFPQNYNLTGIPRWWNVMQWKSATSSQNDPIFTVNVWKRSFPDGPMYFFLRDQLDGVSHDQLVRDIPVGQWTRLEAFYSCRGNNTGRVTIWQDGVQLFDRTSEQTRYPNGDCKWSVNNYSNGLAPNPATVYVDDAAICFGARCSEPLP